MPGPALYDPASVTVAFRGIITEFADGTFIAAERDEDAFTKYVGAQGEVARARNRNRGGSVTFTLMASSPANDILSAAAAADELTGLGFAPLLITDRLGRTVIEAPFAWVKKLPNIEFAKEVGTREWVLDCDKLIMNIGGALTSLLPNLF